jgi:squalene-associated FAD-dependent desaturase
MKYDVIVIGGGIAGLACAVELCASGLSVTVLEKEQRLGGRASSWRDEESGDVVDIGPHILLSEYRNMLRLLDKLGTSDKIVWQQEKFLTLVGEPRPVDIYLRRVPAPLHFLPCLLTLPQVSLRDLLSNRKVMWQTMRLDKEDIATLDRVDAETYFRQMSVSPGFIDWFWRSVCMTIMNVPLQRCSAGAFLQFFRFMIGRNDYKVGFAGVPLSDLFVPGAVACIEAAGGNVHTGSAATALATTGASVTGVKLSDGRRIEASACVAALPPHELVPLLPSSWVGNGVDFPDWISALKKIEPSPYICSYLWFDRKLGDEKFWTRPWAPDNLNYDSYDLSNIRTGWNGRASVIASNVMYSERAGDLSDEEIVARTLQELAEFLPEVTGARLRHSRVHRLPMGVPAAYPGIEALRQPNVTPVPRLFVAGDWTATGLPSSMESAVLSGYRAAEQVLAMSGRPRTLALPPPAAEGLVRLVGGRRHS